MRDYARVLSRVFGAPLLLEPRKAEVIARGLIERIDAGMALDYAAIRAETVQEQQRRLAQKPYAVTSDGVALIDVSGTLVHKSLAAAPPSMFLTYAEIEAHLLDAATDPAIKAIALDVDSPGGEASDSAFALAETVRQVAAIKPTWAIADELMASAAYLISSGASRITMPEAGVVGSIGVIAMHVDRSGENAAAGRKVTIVRAGARKAEGNPHEPLSDTALAQLQASVAAAYDRFVGIVAKNRGIDAGRIKATEAAVFDFAGEAIAAGLVDEVLTPAQALGKLTASLERRAIVTVSQPKENQPMSETSAPAAPASAPAPAISLEVLRASHAPIVAALLAEGAAAERARIQGLLSLQLDGHVELLTGFIADGSTTKEQAAVAIVEAEKRIGAATLQARRADTAGLKVPAAASASEPEAIDPNAPLEMRAKTAWERDPKLRAEFRDNFDAYLAFERATAAGQARILGRK